MSLRAKLLRVGLWLGSALLLTTASLYVYHRLEGRSMARRQVLRIGLQDSPPWYFVRSGGSAEGPVVEMLQEAARRTGIRLEWVSDPAGPEHALGTGLADLWPLMGRLPERLRRFPITDAWLDLSYLAVSRAACDTAAARPPRAVAHRGTDVTRSIVASRFGAARSVPVASHADALRALCAGEVDVALVSELSQPFGALELGTGCAPAGVCLNSIPVSTIAFGIGSRPGFDAAHAAAIVLRAEIDAMIDDGSAAGILLRWGVSSGEIRALRAARLAKARANNLAAIAAGLLIVVIALTLVSRKLLMASRDRLRVNEELLRSQEALKHEFEQRMDAEERYRQSQKMDSLGRMAGGIAHDFNNLLTVINGYSDIALMDLDGHPARDSVVQILKAGQSAADLTKQLLAFSRKQLVRTEPLNLNSVVNDTLDMLRRVIGEDVELITVLDSNISLVLSDSGEVRQVLMNLTTNARDALTGSGKIVIETASACLDGEYAATHPGVAEGDYVMLAVSDSGAGMDETTVQQIFEPFFTTKPEGKGTGLGLATVYGIVRQAGGHINVYSEVGNGTTFRIYLPSVSACPTAARADSDPGIRVGGSETVLVVEDQDDVRRFMVRALRNCGYCVLEAAAGDDALALAASYTERIHLLVTDVVMPRMNGRELSEKLVALRPDLRVLYTSGYTDNAISQRGVLTAGVNFLTKPFRADVLSMKVRTTLDGMR